jgi:hypothetical protein
MLPLRSTLSWYHLQVFFAGQVYIGVTTVTTTEKTIATGAAIAITTLRSATWTSTAKIRTLCIQLTFSAGEVEMLVERDDLLFSVSFRTATLGHFCIYFVVNYAGIFILCKSRHAGKGYQCGAEESF